MKKPLLDYVQHEVVDNSTNDYCAACRARLGLP
jgi:hypothetical protein